MTCIALFVLLMEKKHPDTNDEAHHRHLHRHALGSKILATAAVIALILQTTSLFLSLFEKPLPYRIADAGSEPLSAPEFTQILSATTGGGIYRGNRVEVFTNGDQFYPAELAAIRAAQHYVHVECYILQKGRVATEFLNALEERARAGVIVDLTIDAIGSTALKDDDLAPLRRAGGHAAWYHPVRWWSWPRINNRTHREIVVVDGTVGFCGGAGIADQWMYRVKNDPQWRDTMIRVEGEAATGLEATFAENWLESTGEMLVAPVYFPFHQAANGTAEALVVTSSPTAGRSTEARVLIQSLIEKAQHAIHITNPYFLPDKSLRDALVRAVKRGVEVTIVTPGTKNDHLVTRRSSRTLYGDLLRGGARIFEYQPSMIHAKIMLIDGLWSIAGSTNLDSRSFGLNDEVNVAFPDSALTARLEQDFQRDLSQSRSISYEQWKHRPWWEKVQEFFGSLLQNQE